VAEWLKAAVLKTVKCQSFVGSNPTSSANITMRRNGRVAEGARLLSEYGRYSPSRVRISLSPPLTNNLGILSNCFQFLFLFQWDQKWCQNLFGFFTSYLLFYFLFIDIIKINKIIFLKIFGMRIFGAK
jgi:hypothetical protein